MRIPDDHSFCKEGTTVLEMPLITLLACIQVNDNNSGERRRPASSNLKRWANRSTFSCSIVVGTVFVGVRMLVKVKMCFLISKIRVIICLLQFSDLAVLSNIIDAFMLLL